MKAKPTHEKKRRLTTTYKNHAMKPNPSHPILFYDERETIDPSPAISRRRKFEKGKKKRKKRVFCEFDLFICCTYIRTYLVPTYYTYIHEVILSIISKKPLFFLPKEKSERKRKVREKKRRKSFSHRTYLPRDVGFFFLFVSKRYTDIQVHVGTYLPYTLP